SFRWEAREAVPANDSAQNIDEHLSLLRRQVSEEVRVVLVSQRGELRNESAPGASERHALNAPIVRIERSGDQALRDQPVDDLGYGTLRHPERVDERTRGGWTGG